MKQLLFLLFISFIVGRSSAQIPTQAVINATGNAYVQNTGAIFEWSVGEMVLVETMKTNRAVITNGLLQPVPPLQLITKVFTTVATNILSPNGDGQNDAWVIKDLERYPENEITIFDRSGRVVFHTKNYQNDWKAQVSGAPLAQGTYYYTIKLKKDGKIGLTKGFITILN